MQAGASSTGHSETTDRRAPAASRPRTSPTTSPPRLAAPRPLSHAEIGHGQLVAARKHDRGIARCDCVEPSVRGEVDEIAACQVAANRLLRRFGSDQRADAVCLGDRACLGLRSRQPVQRGVQGGVEGRIADDQRTNVSQRRVDRGTCQLRGRRKVRQRVCLPERMAPVRQHVERKTVQPSVRDDEKPVARVGN
jgi:hypothetical protein